MAKSKPAPPVSPKAKPPKADEAKADVMLVHGVSEDGEQLHVLRARENRLEAGVVTPLKDGEAITGEVVKMTPRSEAPHVCDVEVQVPAGALNAPGAGESARALPSDAGDPGNHAPRKPSKAATPRYRSNWDQIWKKPRKKRELLN